MITDTNSPQPATTVMPHGIQHDAAQALALACGVPLLPYDLAALQQSLAAGQRCVVVWTSPHSAVAEALRLQTAPSEMVAQWRQSIESLLKLFGRFRRKLLLVDARVITQGTADDLANLARRLPLMHDLIAPDTSADLPDLLAQVMVGQLADLRATFDELQASSVSIVEPARTSADLDLVAVLFSDLKDDRARLIGELADLTSRHREEGDLYRGTLADLSASLVQNAKAMEETETLWVEAEQRADLANNEATELREQLKEALTLSASVQSAQADQITAATAATATLEQETALLRDQLRDVFELSATNLASQADAIAAAAAAHESMQQEAALLREHLRHVSAKVVSVLSTQAEQLSAASLASAQDGKETALLRAQLATLSDALAEELANSADDAEVSAELDLARAQLQSLSQFLAEANAAVPPDDDPAPEIASAEFVLLREQLVALHEELNRQADAVPSSGGMDYLQIEAAFAALLASLSAETELRKMAQQQSFSAALALQTRSGGMDRLPIRNPIPPRPQTAPVLPVQNAMK